MRVSLLSISLVFVWVCTYYVYKWTNVKFIFKIIQCALQKYIENMIWLLFTDSKNDMSEYQKYSKQFSIMDNQDGNLI